MVTTKEVDRLVEATNESVEKVIWWMNEQGMELAAEKTGIVVTIGRRKFKSVEIRVGAMHKYLGVRIDKDVKMVQHVKTTAENVDRTTRVLARNMSHQDIPSIGKRRTLMVLIHFILMYAAQKKDQKIQDVNGKVSKEGATSENKHIGEGKNNWQKKNARWTGSREGKERQTTISPNF